MNTDQNKGQLYEGQLPMQT